MGVLGRAGIPAAVVAVCHWQVEDGGFGVPAVAVVGSHQPAGVGSAGIPAVAVVVFTPFGKCHNSKEWGIDSS